MKTRILSSFFLPQFSQKPIKEQTHRDDKLTGLILIMNSKTHKEFQLYLQFVHKAIYSTYTETES